MVMKLTALHILKKRCLWPDDGAQDNTDVSRRASAGRMAGGAAVAVERDRLATVERLQCDRNCSSYRCCVTLA